MDRLLFDQDSTANAAAAAANEVTKKKGAGQGGDAKFEPQYINLGKSDDGSLGSGVLQDGGKGSPKGGGKDRKRRSERTRMGSAAGAEELAWDPSMASPFMGFPMAPFNAAGMPAGALVSPAVLGAPGMAYPAMPYWPPYAGAPMMPGFGMGMPQMGMMAPAQAPPGGGGRGGGRRGGGGAAGAGQKGGDDRREKKRWQKPKGKAQAASPEGSDADNANKSPSLMEVRASNGKKGPSLSTIVLEKNIIEFAEDQHGSKYIQTKLDDATTTPEERADVFAAILEDACRLASDAWGNFVVQKLFDCGTAEQRRQLAAKLKEELLELSMDAHGCRVVQKVLGSVPRETQMALASELRKKVLNLMEHMHGNHVIQKCIEQMPPDSVTFIIQAVEEETVRMATNVYGCRIVQRLLEHCAAPQLQKVLEKILGHLPKLAQDNFGNYVVQHMLEHGRREDKKRILQIVKNNIREFASHKCSSYVIERCVEISTVGEHHAGLEVERRELYAAILGVSPDSLLAGSTGMVMTSAEPPPIRTMMEDRYGNYIVQKMIEHSQRGPERTMLKECVKDCEGILNKSAVGKHIIDACNRKFNMELQH